MKHIKYILLSFVLFTVLGFMSNTAQEKTRYDAPQQLIVSDIKYGKYERNVMDVYLPANRGPQSAFVINIHGGAWVKGDRKQDDSFCKYLLSKGIAVANVNYRYANHADTHLPQLLDDIRAVETYLVAHADEWSTRSKGFSISGASSGAHVAMMYAYTKSADIKSIVERCGPTDFSDTGTLEKAKAAELTDLIDQMSGNTVPWKPGDAVPAVYVQTSPVQHIRNIPLLLIHGDADEVVPVRQAHILDEALTQKQIAHKLVIVPGAGHQIGELPSDMNTVVSTAADWFLQYGIN
ncbi:MAG: alpha/beta hydrolase [Chitinophagaceae bacterium]